MSKKPTRRKPKKPEQPYAHMPTWSAWLDWWAEAVFGVKR